MVDAQEVGEANSPTSICFKCKNACITCGRCEIPYEDARDMITTEAPGHIIVGCTMFNVRSNDEKKSEGGNVDEGTVDAVREPVSDGVYEPLLEWKEAEGDGHVQVRVRVRDQD